VEAARSEKKTPHPQKKKKREEKKGDGVNERGIKQPTPDSQKRQGLQANRTLVGARAS